MILKTLLSRNGQPEKRGFGLKPWVEYIDGLMAGEQATDSGINIGYDSCLAIPTAYACVRFIAETISTLPCITYKRRKEGNRDAREKFREHPLFSVLRYRPNSLMTAVEFWDYLMQSVLLRGNAYAAIVRNKAGDILELIPIHPNRIKPYFENGVLYFEYTKPGGEKVIISCENIFRFRGPVSKDGVTGLSAIDLLRDSLGLARAQDKFSSKFFANGARVAGLLKFPKKLNNRDNLKQIREDFERVYGGSDNAFKTAILEEGMEFQQITMTNEDSQLLESRKFSVEEITRIFNVRPHKVSHLYHATFSNINEQSIESATDTMRPWTVRIEAAIHRDLISDSQKDLIFSEFNIDAIIRGDTKSQNEAFMVGRTGEWLSANDVREKLNMNPIPGGDEYKNPNTSSDSPSDSKKTEPDKEKKLAMEPVEPAVQSDPKPEALDDVDTRLIEEREKIEDEARKKAVESLKPVFIDACNRAISREQNALRKIVKKSETLQEIQDWARKYYGDSESVIADMFNPVMAVYEMSLNEQSPESTGKRAQKISRNWINRALKEIDELTGYGAIDDYMERRKNEYPEELYHSEIGVN